MRRHALWVLGPGYFADARDKPEGGARFRDDSYASEREWRTCATPIGTPGSNLTRRMMRVVFTLATLAAAVSSSITKSWKAGRSGATHFRRKSVSPDSM